MFNSLTLPSLSPPPPQFRHLPPAVHCRSTLHDLPDTTTPDNPPPQSLYEVLRLKHSASIPEIKASYRNLAKIYHPDAASDHSDGLDFVEINRAYETLSNPTSRATYDASMGFAGRIGRLTMASFSSDESLNHVRRRSGFYTSRWETDQCW